MTHVSWKYKIGRILPLSGLGQAKTRKGKLTHIFGGRGMLCGAGGHRPLGYERTDEPVTCPKCIAAAGDYWAALERFSQRRDGGLNTYDRQRQRWAYVPVEELQQGMRYFEGVMKQAWKP